MSERVQIRLDFRVNGGPGVIPAHGVFAQGSETPTGPVFETWLQFACDDGWIEEYRIDAQNGQLVVGASGVHPGAPTDDMTRVEQREQWHGYRTEIPPRGVSSTRLRSMSPEKALVAFQDLRSYVITRQVSVEDAIKIAAYVAHNELGVSESRALEANRFFKRAFRPKTVRIIDASDAFSSLCLDWRHSEADVYNARFMFELACHEIASSTAERLESEWLLVAEVSREAQPATRGPRAKATPSRNDEGED
jgi:hypothetical protein